MHLDADAFFASVETAKNPMLRGKPVVTGSERGIASSMSYEAKALGITRATPIFQIRRFFPQVVVVSSDYEAYALYSKRMFEIVRRYANVIEEYSIDECFADITGLPEFDKVSHEEFLKKIQFDIQRELNISVSLGSAPTKVLAKIASTWNKPHGVAVITKETSHEYLIKTLIGRVWGIGKSSEKLLLSRRIKTAYDLALEDEKHIRVFAHKPLIDIWHELNGRRIMEIGQEDEKGKPKSISKTLTFSPSKTEHESLLMELSRNVENACIKARRYDVAPTLVTWFLKTSDFKFEVHKIKFGEPCNTPSVIMGKIREQFKTLKTGGAHYRTTGVTFSNLCEGGSNKRDLFGSYEDTEAQDQVFKSVDAIGKKYGRHTVRLASSLNAVADRKEIYEILRTQSAFLDTIKKTGKEFYIPYLGEVS
ncbi:MAG: DNA polymerase IV [Patescibacteria group bacterium]